jgi:hypothetical protein
MLVANRYTPRAILEEKTISKRIFLLFGLFLLAHVTLIRPASPQAMDIPRIEVTPIATGGSLITIPNVNLPNLQVQQISDQQLRTAIPKLPALPRNAAVIEIKHAAQGQEAQFLIRGGDPSIWRVVQPSAQATEPPVLWLATTLEKEYRLLTQLAPFDSGQNAWGWPEQGPFAVVDNPKENTAALQGLLACNPQLVIINNRGRLFPTAHRLPWFRWQLPRGSSWDAWMGLAKVFHRV